MPSPIPDEKQAWVESVCDRHPKVTDRVLSEAALVALVQTPGFDGEAFDDSHLAWCQTDEWREKNGRFAPRLAQWIGDKGYLKFPNGLTRAGPHKAGCSVCKISPCECFERQLEREENCVCGECLACRNRARAQKLEGFGAGR
jgi:hypothetical protein